MQPFGYTSYLASANGQRGLDMLEECLRRRPIRSSLKREVVQSAEKVFPSLSSRLKQRMVVVQPPMQMLYSATF
jgi:hypothetical protein